MDDDDVEALDRLADQLAPLGNTTRLRLLALLQTPRTLSEIELSKPEEGRDKPLARQTIKTHLDRLIEAGAIVARDTQREYGETVEYMLDNQALYATVEQLRELAHLTPAEEPDKVTVGGTPRLGDIDVDGPHLVLAKGVPEGRVFGLGDEREQWTIGRSRGVAVSVSADPFVSSENAIIQRESSGYAIADLPESRNGTIVNGEQLDQGETYELEAGDLIAVGKSTLIFRT